MPNTRTELSAIQAEVMDKLRKSRFYKKDCAFKKFLAQVVAYEDARERGHNDTPKDHEEKKAVLQKIEEDKGFQSIYNGSGSISYTTPLSTSDMEISQPNSIKDPTLFQVIFRCTPRSHTFNFSPNSKTNKFNFTVSSEGEFFVTKNSQQNFAQFVFTHPKLADKLASLEFKLDQKICAEQNQRRRNSSPF